MIGSKDKKMASGIMWCLVFVTVVASSAFAQNSRIIGGTETSIQDHPSIVQVEFLSGITWQQNCAASILTTRYLMTAANCVSGLLVNLSFRRIRAGTTARGSGGIVVALNRVFNHPDYNQNSRSFNADLSLMELRSPLTYNAVIDRTAIVPQNFTIPDNIPVGLAGWGATSENGTTSAVLRSVEAYTINREECRRRYNVGLLPRPVTENMLCTGLLGVGGRDACEGDAGGPVFLGNVTIGIISWRHENCGNGNFPSVNTNLASYTNWILQTVQENSLAFNEY